MNCPFPPFFSCKPPALAGGSLRQGWLFLIHRLPLRTLIHWCYYFVPHTQDIIVLCYDAIFRCVWFEPFAFIAQTMFSVLSLQFRIDKDDVTVTIIIAFYRHGNFLLLFVRHRFWPQPVWLPLLQLVLKTEMLQTMCKCFQDSYTRLPQLGTVGNSDTEPVSN